MRIKRIGSHNLPAPMMSTIGSAGYDLCAVEEMWLREGDQELIKTGFAWEIPYGFVGLIKDRSSMVHKHQIISHAGVIDSDYRGEVGVILTNESCWDYKIMPGDRIAQMLIIPIAYYISELEEVDELNDTARGDGGYGSTGR